MKITWYGLSCIYLEGRATSVLLDPFDTSCGTYTLPSLPADIYTISHEHDDHNYHEAISNKEAVRARFGMFEKGVRISSIHTWHDQMQGEKWGPNEVFILDMEGLRIVHLGDLGHELDQVQLAALGHVDMLFIPVGGIYTINALSAARVVNAVNADLTFPIHYHTKHLESADFQLEAGVDIFIQQSGRNVIYLDSNTCTLDRNKLADGSIVVFHLN